MSSFVQRLRHACETNRSLLCVGLDPYPDKIRLVEGEDVLRFNRAIIDATHEHVCAYKPNTSFYEGLGWKRGMDILAETVQYIRKVAPEVVIIGDGKKGDIGAAIQRYPNLVFEELDLDTAIINPYMGYASVEPFLKDSPQNKERGVFLLCHSSNPEAKLIQDLKVCDESGGPTRYLYEQVAAMAKEWNEKSPYHNMGLVVGATYPEQLERVRAICPEMPILIPGIGEQGGELVASVKNGTDADGRMAIINSSRQVLYASQGSNYAEVAGEQAKALKEAINDILFRAEKGWP